MERQQSIWFGANMRDDIRQALVMLAIEKTMLEFNTQIYDLVIRRLDEKYHCGISDCYERPDYLQQILRELFGNVSETIMKNIGKYLEEFSDQKQIKEFIDVITS
jgi:hypothetical protein